MAKTIRSRLLWAAAANASLRIAALGSKLLLLLYIARSLSVSDMAVYGLVTASVGFAVTVLGLEFYAFSTREILAASPNARGALLRDQFVLYGIGYVLLIPLSLPLFLFGVLPWEVALSYYVLTILEHFSHEMARVFNTLFRPVLSTALFFIRSGAWGYAVIGVGWLWPERNNLELVFCAWIAGATISAVLSIVALQRMRSLGELATAIDWAWIRRGLIVAVPFIISALSYRVIELADRYMIKLMLNDTAVGVYAFFGSLANVIPAVIGAGISSVLTPRILEAYLAGRKSEYRALYITLSLASIGASLVAVPISFFFVVRLLPFVGKPEYSNELETCAILLLSTAVAVISLLPSVALYAKKCDKQLLLSVVLGVVTNSILNVLLIPRLGIAGAAWATVWAYAAMGAYQLYWVLALARKRPQLLKAGQ